MNRSQRLASVRLSFFLLLLLCELSLLHPTHSFVFRCDSLPSFDPFLNYLTQNSSLVCMLNYCSRRQVLNAEHDFAQRTFALLEAGAGCVDAASGSASSSGSGGSMAVGTAMTATLTDEEAEALDACAVRESILNGYEGHAV